MIEGFQDEEAKTALAAPERPPFPALAAGALIRSAADGRAGSV